MQQFFNYWWFEWKRFFKRRNIIICSILFVLCHLVLNQGIDDYTSTQDMIRNFKTIEQRNFEKHRSYGFYGDEGINLAFVQAQAAVFNRNTPVPNDFFINLDSYAQLRIFHLFKGKPLYHRTFSGPHGFSDILLLLGSLLALCFGYDTFRHKEFLRMTASQLKGKLFFAILVAKLSIIFFVIAVLFTTSWLHLLIRGIPLLPGAFDHLPVFFLTSLLVLYFFFACGLVTGNITRRPVTGLTIIFSTWLLVNFLIPSFINAHVEKKAPSSTLDLQAEIKKMAKIISFEERSFKQEGKFNRARLEPFKNLIEKYWEQDYPELEKIEDQVKKQIDDCNQVYYAWSYAFPAGFFRVTTEAISSKGIDSFMDFYRYGREQKRNFLRFWIDRVYYHDPKEMVNFVTAEENIYLSQSRVPPGYLNGLLVTLGYLLILLYFAYTGYNKNLYSNFTAKKKIQDKIATQDNANPYRSIKSEPHFHSGEYQVWRYKGETLLNLLYNIFSGKTQMLKKETLPFSVTIDDVDIIKQDTGHSFLYLCKSKEVPGDITVNNLLKLFRKLQRPQMQPSIIGEKKENTRTHTIIDEIQPLWKKTFAQLNENEKAKVLLSLSYLTDSDIYVLNEIADNLSYPLVSLLKKQMENLCQENALVLFLTSRFDDQLSSDFREASNYMMTELWNDLSSCIEESYKANTQN